MFYGLPISCSLNSRLNSYLRFTADISGLESRAECGMAHAIRVIAPAKRPVCSVIVITTEEVVGRVSYEFIQRVGKYSYIYLVEAYRNEKGEPRQRRTPIGEIDPKTGKKNYKPWYLEQLRAVGHPREMSPTEKSSP